MSPSFDTGLGAFGRAVPARDSWDTTLTWVANPGAGARLYGDIYVGRADAFGDSLRQIQRYGTNLSVWWQRWALRGFVKINDWGPYDYHRDFNLTYPLQLMGDVSWGIRAPRLEKMGTRIGLRGQFRRLDEHTRTDSSSRLILTTVSRWRSVHIWRSHYEPSKSHHVYIGEPLDLGMW